MITPSPRSLGRAGLVTLDDGTPTDQLAVEPEVVRWGSETYVHWEIAGGHGSRQIRVDPGRLFRGPEGLSWRRGGLAWRLEHRPGDEALERRLEAARLGIRHTYG